MSEPTKCPLPKPMPDAAAFREIVAVTYVNEFLLAPKSPFSRRREPASMLGLTVVAAIASGEGEQLLERLRGCMDPDAYEDPALAEAMRTAREHFERLRRERAGESNPS